MTVLYANGALLRVMDIVSMQFKMTKEQYLDNFDVEGRFDFDLEIDPQIYNDILDYRTTTKRILPQTHKSILGLNFNMGFIGLEQEPRKLPMGDKDFLEQETHKEAFTKLRNLPQNLVINLNGKITNEELEEIAKSNKHYVLTNKFVVENPPVDLIPIRISGEFIRDYTDFLRMTRRLDDKEINKYLGKSSLTLKLTNTTLEQSIEISELRIYFPETFPKIVWRPENNGRLRPEKRELIFTGIEIKPNDYEYIDLIANPESVLQLGTIKGQLRGEITGYTVSGLNVKHFFLPDGNAFNRANWKFEHKTRILADIELDPKAMEDTVLKVKERSFIVDDIPQSVHTGFKRLLNSLGYIGPEKDEEEKLGDHEIKGDTKVLKYEIDGARKMYDDAVIYLSARILGDYSQYTREREYDMGGISTEKGKRNVYGSTNVRIIVKSTNQKRIDESIDEIANYFIKQEL